VNAEGLGGDAVGAAHDELAGFLVVEEQGHLLEAEGAADALGAPRPGLARHIALGAQRHG
jgi:hypothetical protein